MPMQLMASVVLALRRVQRALVAPGQKQWSLGVTCCLAAEFYLRFGD